MIGGKYCPALVMSTSPDRVYASVFSRWFSRSLLAEEIKSYPLIYIIAALAGILFFVKCIAMHNIPLLKGKP
jgi:hypothetical protein